jgi:hypothetical protein
MVENGTQMTLIGLIYTDFFRQFIRAAVDEALTSKVLNWDFTC